MKKILQFSLIIMVVGVFNSCDLYPDWNDYVEYSSTHPISGEYIVKDYDIATGEELRGPFTLYIYNKANNESDGSDSIWVDYKTGHGTSDYLYKYKIKCNADMENLSFNCLKQGNIIGSNVNPLDSAETVTFTNSKVIDMSEDITDAAADSIYFDIEYSYYNTLDVLITVNFKTAGHRKTGWENPSNDDDM